MSDRNKHSDNLENFFRNGVEKASFEFVEEDWAKMEKMLDEQQPVVPVPWWRSGRLWIPAVLALLVLTGLYFWQNDGIGSTKLLQDTAVQHGEKSANRSNRPGPGRQQPQGMERNTNTSENISGNKQQSVRSNAGTTAPQTNLYGQEQTRVGGGAAPGAAYVAPVQESDSRGRGERTGAAPARFGLDEPIATLNRQRLPYPKVPVQSRPPVIHHGMPGGLHPQPFIPSVETSDAPLNVAGGPEYLYDRYLAVAFTASPDYSAVGFSNFGNSGSRVGMLIEYGFSRRFVVNTGFILTNNRYEAYGRDYQPPYGFWTKGVVPAETYGECRIVDIPLNLRYNFGLWNRHRLFVNAGASSYVMLREKYHYEYYDPDPDLISEWENSKSSVHWFGIGNASIGYEYMLSPRFSVQVEPFVKFALTGIGYGSVELNSFGSYFSLKYMLLK